MNLPADSHGNDLLFAGFNQDNGCFACGMANGFIIYNVDPFRETFRRIFPNGGIGMVEMLFRCNLLAIVGGGRNPRFPTNKVMIWDDHQNKCIGELKFRTEVRAVRLRRDRVVVVLDSKVFVYRFKDLKLQDQITTVANPKGLVSLCPDAKNNVLAVPGLARGSIRVELYDSGKATLIKAHDADLAQFALNADGSRIASASEKGTLIRTWNCHTGEPIRELRRGMDRAEIFCISFNPMSTLLACTSDKGTVHIFSLTGKNPKENVYHAAEESSRAVSGAETHNKQAAASTPFSAATPDSSSVARSSIAGSSDCEIEGRASTSADGGAAGALAAGNRMMSGMGMQLLKGILPGALVPKYFESEWSCAQVRGIDGKAICAFSKDSNRIVVVCADGVFIVANVDEGVATGGDCPRITSVRFLKDLQAQRSSIVAGEDESESWAASGLVNGSGGASMGRS